MTREFPKAHLFAAGGLGLAVTIMLLLSPSSEVEANRISIPLKIGAENITKETRTIPLPATDILAPSSDSSKTELDTTLNTEPALVDIAPQQWDSFKVNKGDTLSTLFKQAGFNDRAMYRVIAGHKNNKQLANIYPGETLAFLRDGNEELSEIRLQRNQLESLVLSRNEDGKFISEEVFITPEVQLAYAEGKIDSSLFLAGQEAGLKQSMIMELANIFGWDIDFILDIRQGDKFNLIYEELYLDGEKYKNGKILAANFSNRGENFSAVLYEQENGDSNYFTPEGESMRKAFIRTPVDFARISSHFNLKRKHPILHKIRAHKGTDYAASRGTPIKATGDGKIINARTKGGYGRTVIIQHGNKISTLYAHMSKYARGIKEGKRVKQGQTIGYIGSSGLASGPHLHYEFRVNGVHKNPLKVKLPHANPIPKAQLARFRLYTDKYLAQLSAFNESYQVASNP